jgi:hypothetical protein
MKYIRLGLFVCIGLLLVTAPIYAAGIVPACAPDCKACDFVQLGQNIIDWFIKVAASIIALAFAWGGAKMVMSGGDTGAVSSARSMMTNAVVGFMILMAGYLIVDTVLKLFLNDQSYGVWNKVQCTVAPPSTTGTTPNVVGTPSGQGPVTSSTTGCTGTCTALGSGINIKSTACSGGSTCTVSSEIAPKLTTLDGKLDAAGVNWQVTEAYPPTRVHQNSCHQQGTCIDANCIGGCSPAQVKTFLDSAQSSGMRAVYEVKTEADKQSLIQNGVSAGNIQVLGNWISAPHFSVYSS